MKVLIIYDSYFGNTEKIAREITGGFGTGHDVILLKPDEFSPDHFREIDMLIVGSPTRAFSPSPAIKKFLKNIPRKGLEGIKVTAFDTRMAIEDVQSGFLRTMVRLFGYAARPIAGKLAAKGGTLIIEPLGFLVKDTEGPLGEGESEKAREWVKKIIAVWS